MSIPRLSMVAAGFGVVVALVGGCSGGGTSTTGQNGTDGKNGEAASGPRTNGDGGTSASAKFTCCLNDVFYVCPDKAAVDQCALGGGADFNACRAGCAGNPSCIEKCTSGISDAKPDPSACTKQSGQACPATKPTTSDPKALCTGIGAEKCTYDSQCGSGRHCSSGACFENEAGTKCTYDSQCGSGNHCTDGCCQGNTSGTTCTYDSQCGSGNHCSSSKCYPNDTGSPCTYDSQCGAGGNCSGGECQ